MTVSVFVGTSVDGFIARPKGDLDFLPPGGGEPHGYNEFIATVDAIVIGRNTFETVLGMEGWPYEDKRVVVLSSRAVDLSKARGDVEHMGGAPVEIVKQLAASGANHLYIDGGITVQGFLRAGATPRDHTRAGAHRRGDSSVWQLAARRSTPSRGHSVLCERPGAERV